MKKNILLMAVVAISAMTASAQKFTINVETLAPKTKATSFMENLNSAVANVAPKAALKKAPGATKEYIEVNADYSDGEYEDEVTILATNTVEVTPTGENGTYEGKEYPMIELNGFGSGYCTCTGYLDEEGGHIYIPRQVAYEYKTYGEMYIEALYINASGKLDWDGLDVILTKNEETGNYVCWEGNEEIGSRIGWVITMTGDNEGSIWTYGIESDLLIPNGVETGAYNWGDGYVEETYPVYIAMSGEDLMSSNEVYVYNFLGQAALGMIIEDGDVYIPTGQPVAKMPAAAGYETEGYGEYFRTYAYGVEGDGIFLDEEADYSMATLDGNKIDMGEDGYIGVWSKFDADGKGYRIGLFGDLSWTIKGTETDVLNEIYNEFVHRLEVMEKTFNNAKDQTVDNPKYSSNPTYEEIVKDTRTQFEEIWMFILDIKESAENANAEGNVDGIKELTDMLSEVEIRIGETVDYFFSRIEAYDVYGKAVLNLTSDKSFYNSGNYTADVVTYTRNFSKQTQKETSAGWETIVLPFDVTYILTEDDKQLAPFGSTLAEAGVALPFWLAELKDGQYVAATSIRANVPYIISMPNGDDIYSKNRISGNVIFFAHNATVYASNGTQTMQGANGFAFVPTYDFVEASDGVYAINDEVFSEGAVDYQPGSVFVHNSRTVRPFEAYMQLNQDYGFAPRFLPVMADETDGIVTITPDTDTVSIYDLSGCKINAMRKGVNIVVKNGKVMKIKGHSPL